MTLQTMSFIFGAFLLAVGILGGGFEVKEVKVSNVTTTGRILAAFCGAAFIVLGIVLGFWQPGPTTPDAVAPRPVPNAVSTITMSEREHDKNRNGGDYTSFDIRTDHVEDCEAACKADARCFAWTYVKPGILKKEAICALKNAVPAITDNPCCVSGTKARRAD